MNEYPLFQSEIAIDAVLGLSAMLISVMGIGLLILSKGIKRYLGILLGLALAFAVYKNDLTIVCTILAINGLWLLFSGFLVRAEQQTKENEEIV